MKTQPIPQLGPATALVQLLTEHPELPATEWSMSSVMPELRGFVYGAGMQALAEYAAVLGGTIRAAENTYVDQRQEVRAHRLSSVWRDVPVVITVSLPVAAEAVAA
ncbi:hypothetical protein [Streptomyces sp. SID5910]|uniref:hypothetical protein n=1 Tax=Streptomyces sp. SID5910 TaxID=2690312 RepID=UPI001369E13E|nr:hypothetical protein [Streptomyces sp. SID5910]MYR46748.1 hypothetical protein [Streptomyces sp. SID5910]